MTREGYKRYAFNIGSAIRERRCAIGMTRMRLAIERIGKLEPMRKRQ